MQVQKISFTSAEQTQQKEPALYSKRGYMNQVRGSQSMFGFLATYGILETIDKFQLSKKTSLSKDALKKAAKTHTKYNLLWGLAGGIASPLIGKFFIDKYTIPFAEKAWDFKLKQEEISAKTKELMHQAKAEVNQEKIETPSQPAPVEPKEKPAAEIKEEIKQEKQPETKEEQPKKEKEEVKDK